METNKNKEELLEEDAGLIDEDEDEEQIDELEVKEQCRERISIWYGSRDNFYHGALEILMNANDEVTNYFDSGIITVELLEDCKTISIEDTGRGIPIHKITKGVPNHEVLFKRLFSGTNYKNMGKNKRTTGANGVGTCVLNHTSLLFRVESWIEGKHYSIEYIDGGMQNGDLQEDEYTGDKHGTKVTFMLDPDVYPIVEYDPEVLKGVLYRISGVSNTIKFVFKHTEEIIEYYHETELDYFEENIENKIVETVEFKEREFVEPPNKDGDIEVNNIKAVMCISPQTFQQTFLNYTYLKEDGAIFDGYMEGLKTFFNKTAKPKEKFTDSDILMSFSFISHILSNNVEFSNQTKFSTNKVVYKRIAKTYMMDNMEALLQEKEETYNKMLDHLLTIQQFNSKSNKKKQDLVNKLKEKVTIGARVKKFVDCRSKDTEKTELYIVEGDSALGSCKLGRNAEFQAVMPVRGKILNCLKSDFEKIFNSDIIVDLIKVIGCGIEVKSKHNKDLNSFDIDNLRWSKVIICTDADVDGFQIRTLILTMIYRLMPTLIEQGKVFIAETPLYEINVAENKKAKTKERTYFAYSDKEKNNVISLLGNEKFELQRSKGLGQNNPDMMWQTTMNPETRRLTKVTMSEVNIMNEYFELFLGDNVETRKNFIAEHGHKYIDL